MLPGWQGQAVRLGQHCSSAPDDVDEPHSPQVPGLPEQRLYCCEQAPAQHICPVRPHATQEPPVQVAPLLQVDPEQQGCPGPPQAQVPDAQVAPALQVFPLQQTWLKLPQAVQLPLEQVSVLEPQVLPPQQGWPAPPQATQLPPEQMLVERLHEFPVQQGWPTPPQAAHWVPEQSAPALQVDPQQGCPTAPHEAQTPPVPQIVPVLQVDPQHGSVLAPQAVHFAVLEEQRNPVAQLIPAQQG
jgi:hypothetical protein